MEGGPTIVRRCRNIGAAVDEESGDGDPELLLQTLARMDQSVLRAELTALAAATVLDRAEAAAEAPAVPLPLAAEASSPRPEPRAVETRAPAKIAAARPEPEAAQDGQWAEWLQRELDEVRPAERGAAPVTRTQLWAVDGAT